MASGASGVDTPEGTATPQVFRVGSGAEKTPRMTKQEYVSYSKKNAKAKGKKK
jgi:hypothetical protein